MKPYNTKMPKEGRSAASRAISPSFRTGPRQRPSDASTDEIVRFVREYQRSKPSPQTHTISAMKTKAVLPSIERKRSDLIKSQDKRVSMSIDEESYGHHYESTSDMDVDSKYAASRITDYMQDRVEQSFDIGYDAPLGNKASDSRNHGAGPFDMPRTSGNSKDIYLDEAQKRHSNYDISLGGDLRLSRSNGDANGRNSFHRDKRGSVNAQGPIYHHHTNEPNMASTDQSFFQNNSSRSNALRQLPPITNKEVQSSTIQRPSAPSPNKASPGLESASDSDSDGCGYDNNEDGEDGGSDNDDGYDEVEVEETEGNIGEIDAYNPGNEQLDDHHDVQNEDDNEHDDYVENNDNNGGDVGNNSESESDTD